VQGRGNKQKNTNIEVPYWQ